ncbi:MAG: hypothetical protein OIN85_03550 [Candidatus Methanoperedens sp.]|nr:hypothetical protein [Candidatus Methanoperedens sp.]
MKKLLLICIVIVGIVFVAGCIGKEKATNSKTNTESQTRPKSNTQIPDLIIKQSDVPGLTLEEYNFIEVPKNSSFNYTAYSWDVPQVEYKDVLRIGFRNSGEDSKWMEMSGPRVLDVVFRKFDSNDGIEKLFADKQLYCENIKAGKIQTDEYSNNGCDSPNIGDKSFYTYYTYRNNRYIEATEVLFVRRNYLVIVKVGDLKGESVNESIRIAKIVERRLD